MSAKYSKNWLFINSPKDLPNLVSWHRFNTGITVTGAGVSQWDDQSGNAHHLLQTTDTQRPSKESDGSILFDGVDNNLEAGSFTLIQPFMYYLLVKSVSWTNANRLIDGTGNHGSIRQGLLEPNLILSAGLTGPTHDGLAVGVYGVVSSLFDGVSSLLNVNKLTEDTSGGVGSNDPNGIVLAARHTPEPSATGHVQIKEAIVYDTVAHTLRQKVQLRTYLNRVGEGVF